MKTHIAVELPQNTWLVITPLQFSQFQQWIAAGALVTNPSYDGTTFERADLEAGLEYAKFVDPMVAVVRGKKAAPTPPPAALVEGPL